MKDYLKELQQERKAHAKRLESLIRENRKYWQVKAAATLARKEARLPDTRTKEELREQRAMDAIRRLEGELFRLMQDIM
ncbi:hypothetical protein VSS37_05970 [Candidatus Thiothrix sp. Deng01]|uniref:Uncharacterized protein n=1 Tax=Candidatus Thiothrix phosphatis TaxID=3112415 RepID=A0ABU6CUR5_9GAMM|nr:hypothetical protein [Candidatus Thiothrix sp. Deng01]MEB4590519.1 hypothetical protein [Candidatus Thiothrix sp. Deng01]